MTSLARLPLPLVRHVLEFLVSPTNLDAYHAFPRPRSHLADLSLVSKEWNEYADDIGSLRVLERLIMTGYETTHIVTSRSGLLELRRLATLQGKYLREYAIEAFPFAKAPYWLRLNAWWSVLSLMPKLEVLDLRHIPRDEPNRIAFVIRAAGELCPNIRALLLPRLVPSVTVDEVPLIIAVMNAMYKWNVNSVHGGDLRVLDAPMQFTMCPPLDENTSTWVRAIADYCPRIERIPGYEGMLEKGDIWACRELWYIDTALWTEFCKNCSELREFAWVVVPFATSFFEIFGKYPKPRLEYLNLTPAMNWDWYTYREAYNIPKDEKGYGPTARNIHAILKACPALTELVIFAYVRNTLTEPESELLTLVRPDWPPRSVVEANMMMDQEIFGDEFFEALAVCCPNLERLQLWRAGSGRPIDYTLMSFTDNSLRALATLPRLANARIKSVNVTGDGLFDLIVNFEKGQWLRPRCFEITVGDGPGTATELAFYDAVEQFLKRLVDFPDGELLPCVGQDVQLHIVHGGAPKIVDRAWGAGYLETLRSLLRIARRKHPEMKFRVLVQFYNGGSNPSFGRILNFAFYSEGSQIRDYYEWNRSNDRRIDDVFVEYQHAREY